MSRKRPAASGGTGNRRRALGILIAVSLVGGIAVFLGVRDKGEKPVAREETRLPLIPRDPIAESAPAPPPDSPAQIEKRAQAALADWRNAILTRDADMVAKLDMAFLEAPEMFVEGLKESASTDKNERVRAFSTRALGKLKRVDLVPTFQHLLGDENPYVRKNAAWALGELSSRDEGRVAARSAKGALRKLARRDPAEDVRAAARTTLEKID